MTTGKRQFVCISRAALYGIIFMITGCQIGPMTMEEATLALSTADIEKQNYDQEGRDWGILPTATLRGENFHAPTPTTIPEARVISTFDLLEHMNSDDPPLLIDVLDGRQSLPGAIRMSAAGRGGGEGNEGVQAKFEMRLTELTEGNLDKHLVIFCLSAECWLSYNATLRAVNAGFVNVAWYRGGINAWKAAHLATVRAK